MVHEESSQLSTQLRSECIADGLNIVVDKVLHSADGAKQLMAELDEAGYRVEIVEVRVPFEVSQQRITRRWEEAYEASLHGEDDLGARWVPYQFARKVFDAPGTSPSPRSLRRNWPSSRRRCCATARTALPTATRRMPMTSAHWKWTCPEPVTERNWQPRRNASRAPVFLSISAMPLMSFAGSCFNVGKSTRAV